MSENLRLHFFDSSVTAELLQHLSPMLCLLIEYQGMCFHAGLSSLAETEQSIISGAPLVAKPGLGGPPGHCRI